MIISIVRDKLVSNEAGVSRSGIDGGRAPHMPVRPEGGNGFNNGCRDTMPYNTTLAILIALVTALFMTATGVYWMAWALLLGAGTLFLIKQRNDDKSYKRRLSDLTFTQGKRDAMAMLSKVEREPVPSYMKNVTLKVLRELIKVS